MRVETALLSYLRVVFAVTALYAAACIIDGALVKLRDWQRRRRDRSSNSGRES